MAKQGKYHNQFKISVIKIKIKLSSKREKQRKDHNQVQDISDEDKDQVLKSLFKQVNITRTWIIQAQGKMSSEDMNEPLFNRIVSKNQTSEDQDA